MKNKMEIHYTAVNDTLHCNTIDNDIKKIYMYIYTYIFILYIFA